MMYYIHKKEYKLSFYAIIMSIKLLNQNPVYTATLSTLGSYEYY